MAIGTDQPALARRTVAAATIGNALEFYDFITYAFFSIQIGHAFFPAHDPYASLMLSLATFGAGFITRPIGGVIIGAYSDRVGRRPAMMLSFTLMGAAIITIALIPPYAKIGLAAPVLAVLHGGALSDRIGRRPVMIWSNLANLLMVLPAFLWIIKSRSPLALVVSLTALGFVGSIGTGAFFTAVSESLPKRIRGGAFATIYASAIAVCGGTTQLVITWLIHVTGSPMAPAWYLLAASAVGLGAMMLILESAPAKTV